MTPEQRKGFERLLTPRHIAFIGGTDAIIAIGESKRVSISNDISESILIFFLINP